MKGSLPFAAAVVAAVGLVGSAVGAAGGGTSVSVNRIPLTPGRSLGRPRALEGVPHSGSYAFLLKLKALPTGRVYEATLPEGKSAARTAAESQLATVRAAQRTVIAALPSGSHLLYQTHAVLAGVGVYTKVSNVPALQRIAGVAAVYPIAPKKPSLSYSVLLQRAPQVWATNDTGAGSSIAVIDTGVDYTHADFGGSGNPADYTTALAHDTQTPTYPDTNKISTESYDFAGDAYDASDPAHSMPAADPNPLDCNGHGTHTAGIAAGYGENASDGSTFTGDYTSLPTDPTSYQALFRIGPGMAPKAKIFSYKIFGCAEGGTTDLVTEAIDRAADPNNDGSTSDHVDVISMSLGGDFASPQDGDSVASNAASQLGISVVAAAGNGGDLYDITGSPGNAQRAIAAAASVDAYSQIDTLHATVNGVSKTYGAQRSVNFTNWATGDFNGETVVKLSDPNNQDGCDPISQNLAGKVAFLQWTDDETARRCGSLVRADNVEAAGGKGVILGESEETFAAGIAGNADIPVVQVVKSASDEISAALGASETVIADSTSAGDFQQLIPANDDKVADFSSRGIREAGDLKPDVSAVGASVFSAGFGTGNEGISESGTSMATPMVAGLSALVHSAHTGWNPEEVKADIMNTADQDLFTGDTHTGTAYAPNRVGAGRIDAQAALANNVLAYVTDDPGAVSASFGPLAVSTATTLHKTLKVANKGPTSETYDTSYDALTSIPGVAYSVSPSQVTVAGGASTTVTLTLTINPTQLTKTIDPTVDRNQEGLPREYVADASGRVLLTPHDTRLPQLRVPVYSAPRPASVMTQPSSIHLPAGAVQTASLALSGQGVNQGTGLTSIQSLVAGFELQATSGALPNCGGLVTTGCIHAGDERAADLKYVGTTSDAPQLSSINADPLTNGLVYFAISTQGPWHTAASQNEYDVVIDTNGDGVPDAIVFNTRFTGTDVFVSATEDMQGNVLDVEPINARLGDTDSALFDSDTLVEPVAIAALPGVAAGHSRISYGVATFSTFSNAPVDTVGLDSQLDPNGTLSMDVLNPGVAVFGTFTGSGSPLLYRDTPGTSLHLRTDRASYAADHSEGALLVHFQNTAGNKAQVVQLDHSLSVRKKGTGKGTVSSVPAGISCGATCSHLFASGTSETLTAHHAAGSKFSGWKGGGCSGTGRCKVTLNDETPVTATFRDSVRPRVTSLKVKVNHGTSAAKATFRGTDPGHGSKGLRFKCKLDKGKFKSCRSPKLYKHLRRGKHTVQVRAIDKAGNVSKTVKRRFKV